MPFVLIKGRFCPGLGQPDGDSCRFRADDNTLWSRLEGRHAAISRGGATIGTVQLRFEGIDAIEKAAIEPLASQARDNMKRLVGHSAADPEPRGCILARMTDDQSRRPIAFVFAGEPPEEDGADVFLDDERLETSVNWLQVAQGFAYPLYYNTLFASLRRAFDRALEQARAGGLGYWPTDATMTGVAVHDRGDLDDIPPIWPKLWRRLAEHLGAQRPLSAFVAWLEEKNERIDIIPTADEKGLQDVVEVSGATVRLTVPPEDIRVVGAAGERRRLPVV